MSADISPRRGALLLIGLRLRRIGNRLRSRRGASGPQGKKRQATPGKGGLRTWLLLFIASFFLLNSVNLSVALIDGADVILSDGAVPAVVALELLLLSFASLCLELGMQNRQLAQLDWDMEWLLTLPASVPTLLMMKVAETTVVNVVGWFALAPLLGALGWWLGLRWAAVPLGVLLALPLLLLIALTKEVAELLLRRYCPALLLRNLQAAATVLGVVALWGALLPAQRAAHAEHVIWGLLARAGHWPLWLPTGLPVWVLSRIPAQDGSWLPAALALAGVVGTLAYGQWRLLGALAARGMVAGGVRQGTRSQVAAPRPAIGAAGTARLLGRTAFGGIAGKDLLLLLRDRPLLVNTLLVPVLMFAMQLVINPRLLDNVTQSPRYVGLAAFLVGSYTLVFSSMRALPAEGQALWILHTLPHDLSRLLWQKTVLWAGLACVYTLAVLAYGWVHLPVGIGVVAYSAYALAGIPLYALLGTALGALAFDPQDPEPRRQVPVSQFYLYMLLAGVYASGFLLPVGAWPRAGLLVILGMLVLALWQKVRDLLPFVLDPVAAPPPRLSLSDGMAAVLLFFVALFVYGRLLFGTWQLHLGPALLGAYGLAGATSIGAVLFFRWRAKTVALWTDLGLRGGRGWRTFLGAAVGFSLPALGTGLSYLWLLRHWPPLHDWLLPPSGAAGNGLWELGRWFPVLAIGAAPLCEELIFRGMIFRGLRRSHGLWQSVLASSLLFAVVHPAAGAVPVFVAGCCAALACEAAGSVLAGMVVHASYNLMVILLASA